MHVDIIPESVFNKDLLKKMPGSYRRVLHYFALDVAEHVAPVVDEELVVLEDGVGRRVLTFYIP